MNSPTSQNNVKISERHQEADVRRASVPIPTKAFVVGKYDEYGQRLKPGKPTEDADIVLEDKRRMVDHARSFGKLMPGYVVNQQGLVVKVSTPTVNNTKTNSLKGTKLKKLTKVKAKKSEPVIEEEVVMVEPEEQYIELVEPVKPQAVNQPAPQGFNVTFMIDSGKIKSKVDAVLETNNALLLVYANDDVITYTPAKGNKLVVQLPDKRKLNVMFLGMNFEWYNSLQQLLVFMKVEESE